MQDEALTDSIRGEVAWRGWHVVRTAVGEGRFYTIARGLGSVVRVEDIRLGMSARGAHRSRPLGFHTDQHHVDLVAWWCVRPEPRGGPTLLFDTRPLIDALDDGERALLRRVTMHSPAVDGGTGHDVPLLRGPAPHALYYAAWNVRPLADPAVNAAWKRFRDAVETRAAAEHVAIDLAPGEVLVIDNRRVLHGRGALPDDSGRWLKRAWIATPRATSREILPPGDPRRSDARGTA